MILTCSVTLLQHEHHSEIVRKNGKGKREENCANKMASKNEIALQKQEMPSVWKKDANGKRWQHKGCILLVSSWLLYISLFLFMSTIVPWITNLFLACSLQRSAVILSTSNVVLQGILPNTEESCPVGNHLWVYNHKNKNKVWIYSLYNISQFHPSHLGKDAKCIQQ